MANIISFDDLEGQLALPDDQDIQDDFNDFVTEYEPAYLKLLLGEDLYLLFKDQVPDPASTELPEKWGFLINGTIYTDADGLRKQYKGLKEMLLRFVFVYFVREMDKKMSAMGIVVEDTETGKQANREQQASIMQARYNEAVELYQSAQDYIEFQNDGDPDTYPNYETTVLEKKYWGGWL